MGQPAEDVIHRDPHPTNAGFAVALVSLDSDARVPGSHVSIISQPGGVAIAQALRELPAVQDFLVRYPGVPPSALAGAASQARHDVDRLVLVFCKVVSSAFAQFYQGVSKERLETFSRNAGDCGGSSRRMRVSLAVVERLI